MKNLFTALLFHFQQLECQRHKCDSCGKSFTDLGYLKKHVKAQHEGQQMQKCEFCAKSFSALKTHIKIIHDGNKDQNKTRQENCSIILKLKFISIFKCLKNLFDYEKI